MDAGTGLQVYSAFASSAAFVAAVKVVFMAGRMVQKVEDIDQRVSKLEGRHAEGD